MGEYNDALDWKTVFKKILNGEEQSDEKSSLSLKAIHRSNSTGNIKTQDKELLESVTSKSRSSKNSSTSSDKIPEDIGNQAQSFQNLTLVKKCTSEFIIDSNQDLESSTKLNFIEGDKSNQAPEWNKVFRSILGRNSSVPALVNQKVTPGAMKKQKNLQKCDTSVKKRSTSRNFFHGVPKSKDPEEEKVSELFALSRMFKLDYHNLNDFDGAGVDIFKCGKISSHKVEISDKALKDEYGSELFVPLKGFVAKSKPYTTAELISSPTVPFTEPAWDDELFI